MNFRNSITGLTCLLFFIIIGTTCNRKTTYIPAPPETYNPLKVPVAETHVQCQASMPIAEVEKMANKLLPAVLYEDQELSDDQLVVVVKKKGDVKLSFNKSKKVGVLIPLSVYVKAKLDAGFVSVEKEATFDFEPQIESAIWLDESYQLQLKSQLTSIRWITKPTLDAGFMRLDLSTVLENVIMSQQDKMLSLLDRKLEKMLNFKPIVEKVWQLAQEPIRIDEKWNTWVKLVPHTLAYTGLNGDEKYFRLGVQLIGTIETYSGIKPDAGGSLLPKLKIWDGLDSTFTANIVSYVFFDMLENQVNSLAGTGIFKFQNGNQSIEIVHVKLFGSADDLIIKAQVKGSFNGHIYLRAKPHLDTLAQTLRLRKVSFDLQTTNFLHRSAGWLLQSSIEKQLEKKLFLSYKEYIQTSVSQLNTQFSNNKPLPFVTLRGKIEHLKPEAVHLSPHGLAIITRCSGYFSIQLDNL